MNNHITKLLKLKRPMIYCYTILGSLFSIIDDKDLPWIYNNFTQISYHNDWRMFIFEDQINLFERCPFFRIEYIVFDENQHLNRTFIDTLTYIIDNDYYAFLFLDWKYIISDKTTSNLAHTTLISGYDKRKNVFYLSDNYDNGKFVTLEIDMNTVEKAFYSAWTSSLGNKNDNDGSEKFTYLKTIIAFKYNAKVFTEFDTQAFVKQLESFICSDSINIMGEKNSAYYGFSSYNLIIENLQGENQLELETKNFHLLYEHKYLMLKRLEYMANRNIISQFKHYVERAIELSNEFLLIRNLYIKSQLVNRMKKSNVILDICKKIKLSIANEKTLYEDLIVELEQTI